MASRGKLHFKHLVAAQRIETDEGEAQNLLPLWSVLIMLYVPYLVISGHLISLFRHAMAYRSQTVCVLGWGGGGVGRSQTVYVCWGGGGKKSGLPMHECPQICVVTLV